MVANVLYLDSSALVKLILPDAESASMLTFVADHPRQVTSVIARVEVPRAILKLGGSLGHRVEDVLANVGTVALNDEVTNRAAILMPSALRSLDAIHLASAMEFGSDLEVIVTYDRRMIDAARALGLPVVSPT